MYQNSHQYIINDDENAEPIELEVNANHWENKGEIREEKVWIITTE